MACRGRAPGPARSRLGHLDALCRGAQAPNGLDGEANSGYPNGMNGKETFDNVKGIAQPGVWPSDKKPPFKLSIAGSSLVGSWEASVV